MKNYLIVINPVAGKRDNAGKIEQIQSFFEKQDIPFSMFLSSKEVRADHLVKHQFSAKFKVICELNKKLERPETYRFAMIYMIKDNVEFSLAYDLNQQRISSGFNMQLLKMKIELAFSYISQVGFYSGLGISYHFISKK